MKLIGAAFGIAAMCAVGAAAQNQTIHEHGKEKIEVKDGKKVTVSGCLERSAEGQYLLTNEEGGMKYALVTNKNLSHDVGRLVQVRGKATDRGDAKVKVESKAGTSGVASSTTTTGDSKTEMKGDLGLRFLGVDSVKRLASHCR